jgi:superfamily II DNA helicase RecQ
MHLKIFTIPLSAHELSFDTTELDEFQSLHIIEDIQTHFLEIGSLPCVLVFMRYLPSISLARSRPAGFHSGTKKHIQLEGRSKEIADSLKDWRKKRAASEGVPPFLVLTNQEVSNIALTRPASLKDLGDIKGIGKAKLKNYGSEILEILRVASPEKATQKREAE